VVDLTAADGTEPTGPETHISAATVLMTSPWIRSAHPALGREYRMRSFVPNVSSIIRNCKRVFEQVDELVINTLEQVFVFAP
jgi:hypothetical protein